MDFKGTYQRPTPDNGAVVSSCGPVFSIYWVTAVCRVCHEHPHIRHQTDWETSIEMIRGLIQECRQLSLIRRVQKEMAETYR